MGHEVGRRGDREWPFSGPGGRGRGDERTSTEHPKPDPPTEVPRKKETTQLLIQKSGVYKIPCFCSKVYIGQMSHHISTRISKHIRHTSWRTSNQR
jgi:hypothetical protein